MLTILLMGRYVQFYEIIESSMKSLRYIRKPTYTIVEKMKFTKLNKLKASCLEFIINSTTQKEIAITSVILSICKMRVHLHKGLAQEESMLEKYK